MLRLALPSLALSLLSLGCGTAESAEASTFRPSLAEGHSASEHTEVAPGIFLLSEKLERGEVRFVSDSEAHARETARTAMAFSSEVETCYNNDFQNYEDSLSNSTMWGSNPSWYGVAGAWSFHYDPPGTAQDTQYEQVEAYLWSASGGSPITAVTATAYLYVNGDYAGYITDARVNRTTALALGIFDAECVDGSVSIEVRTYHSWSNREPDQYLYLSNTATATAECCP